MHITAWVFVLAAIVGVVPVIIAALMDQLHR